jgi:hypothetical protein
MNVRAKFECVKIEQQPLDHQKLVEFSAVISGSDENKSFSKYTPSGNLKLWISDETLAADFFELNKEYYLDFSKSE